MVGQWTFSALLMLQGMFPIDKNIFNKRIILVQIHSSLSLYN
jgi:hypothetical protein